MATVKSSAENLTLNADGSGNDIIFQSNGSNIATLDQAGLLTATTFAGSGASLTALPAAQVSGTHTSFTSTGIDDNADATAITIDSAENVGIGYGTPTEKLHLNGTFKTAGKVGLNAAIHADAQVNIYTGDATDNGLRINAGSGSYTGTALEVQIARQSGESSYTLCKMISKHDNASPATRFSVRGDGLTTVDGILNVKTGITFASDTAAANQLNDYEEGNFTPVFLGSSGSVGSYDTGEHEASYQKIGNWVKVIFTITISNKGSWGGEVRFTALPFIPDGTWHASGDCNFSEVNYSGGSVGNCSVYTTNGVNYWRVFLMQDNDVSTLVQVSDVDNATRFSGSFTYTASR